MLGSLFLKGLIIGILVSVPLGPIGLLVIQKTVNKNRIAGLMSGIGVSLADTFYAIIAGFSLTYIINFIKQNQIFFLIIGAIILVSLGLNIFFKNPLKEIRKFRRKGGSYFQDLLFTFLITISNPIVIFIFLAVLTGSGIVLDVSKPYEAFFIILGIFIGGSIWWIILTGIVGFFRHRFNLRVLWWINKIAGITIIALVISAVIYRLVTGEFI